MKIKNICVFTYEYPSDKKMAYTFLEQLVNEFTDLGINCHVIVPQSISRNLLRKEKINKRKYNRLTSNNNIVKVYSPYHLTYGKKNINRNLNNYIKSATKIFKKLSNNINFDVLYAQFIFPAAICANKIKKEYNIPAFLAYGEHSGYTIDYFGKDKTRELLNKIDGVISVSNENKNRLLDNEIFSEENIEVFPNAINNKVFYKKNKEEMRDKLKIDNKDFVIAFVGRFIERKGIDRLCEALNIINNESIKVIFIGSGDIKPSYKNIIFEGELDQREIVNYLSASDIFVLPTNSEGCCNAIIEALACGLPVISSKEKFNDDILDASCSIRIDSMNVDEIAISIKKLYNDSNLRKKLSIGALERAKKLNLQDRAKNIIKYMENVIDDN